jgi:site-specific DNA-methyltransferase (adenine-specific)
MDCLEGMKEIPDGTVDMVLSDLPYGITQNAWDSVIDLGLLWTEYKRVLRPGGAVVLTASQPFTSELVTSNREWFRYEWIWRKNTCTGHLQSKQRPLKNHESVLVFGPKLPAYYPQGLQPFGKMSGGANNQSANWSNRKPKGITEFTGYPRTVLEVNAEHKPVHPTQKPVALFEYLIRTYTNPGDLVLDNCMGSGTTAVACINTGRNFIGFETDPKYYQICLDRIATARGEQKAA